MSSWCITYPYSKELCRINVSQTEYKVIRKNQVGHVNLQYCLLVYLYVRPVMNAHISSAAAFC